ncbi:MAG TPA: hypothetical protein VIM58_10850, partial [Candidatus Methylacidiphilales bacterium]
MNDQGAWDDLLGEARSAPAVEKLAEGAFVFRGAATAEAPAIWEHVLAVSREAPFRHMTTPGGFRMAVAMTN